MRLRSLLALLLLPGLPVLAARPPAAAAPPGFGEVVEVNVVNVEVYATDKAGNRVTGLKKEDFTVFEDGKPVEITNFAAVAGAAASPRQAVPPAGSPPETKAAPAPAAQAAATGPGTALSLVVLVDNLYLRPANRTRAVEQVRRFLAENVRPGDRVMLATNDLKLNVRQPFTDAPGALDATLREIETLPAYGGEADRARSTALRAVLTLQEVNVKRGDPCSPEVASPVEGYAQTTRQEVLRALQSLTFLVNSLAGIQGRKALLYVSDGLPVTPGEELYQVLYEMCGGGAATSGIRLPEEVGVWDAMTLGPGAYPAQQALLDAQKHSTAKEFSALVAHANANRVTFYTLQASGLQGHANAAAEIGVDERLLQLPIVQSVQTTNLQNSLSVLAVDTGGRAILNANQFLPDLTRMREDFESYYSLGYTPAHNGDGREHRIEVRVKRPGLRLRYRQSYRDKPTLEKIVDRTLASLLYGIEDNPLEIKVEIGDQTPGSSGTWTVPVRLRIPLFKLAILNHEEVGLFEGNLRLVVAVRTADGDNSPLRQVAVPIRIPRKQVLNAMGQFYLYTLTLQLKPGQQQVAVAVRDEIGATTSYLSRSLEVGEKLTPSSR